MNTGTFSRLSIVLIGIALCLHQATAQQETETPGEEVVAPIDSDTDEMATNGTAGSAVDENDGSVNQVVPDEPQPPSAAEEAYRRALQHEEKNELQEAIVDCTEAIRLDPDNIEYLTARAQWHWEMRDQNNSMADADRVLELDPTNIRARTLRGILSERSGDVEKALIEFNTAVKQNPTSLEALKQRQYYFERQGQSDKAREDAERMVQLEPDSAQANVARALSGSNDDQRINFATAAIQQDPENWNAYKLRGLSRAVEGDFAGATSDFEKALELSPNNALVFGARGAMYYMEADYEKSLADSQKAAELAPRNCSILAILADRLATCPDSNLRDPKSASEYAAAALRLDPNEPLVWRACASAAAANGNFDEAKKWQERVLNSNILLSYQKAEARKRLLAYNSGRPYFQKVPAVDEVLADKKIKQANEAIRNGNFDRAVVLCSEVIRTDAKKARAYDARGLAYLKQDNHELAAADFTAAIGINPKDASAYFYRARVFERTKQYGKARDDLLKSYDLDPESETGMPNNLAWFFATCPDNSIRDGGKASEYVDRALEIEPNHSPIWDTCAAVFAENSDFEDAIDWEQAYIDRPDVDEDQRKDARERLAFYQRHQPYHNQNSLSDIMASATPEQPGK